METPKGRNLLLAHHFLDALDPNFTMIRVVLVSATIGFASPDFTSTQVYVYAFPLIDLSHHMILIIIITPL